MVVRIKRHAGQCWAQNKHTVQSANLTERLSIIEKQHGMFYAEIELWDREEINSEGSQMTSEVLIKEAEHELRYRLVMIGP